MADIVKSIFRQRKVVGNYIPGFGIKSYPECMEEVISDDVIGTYDVEIPLLEEGENFFLSDIEKTVKIKRRMRSSDSSIVYYAEDIISKVDDLETDKLGDYVYKMKYEQIKKELEKYKKEYKYKNKFFNFKVADKY